MIHRHDWNYVDGGRMSGETPAPVSDLENAERECAACGERVPHTMTHGLEGEPTLPTLWNDRLVAKNSPYAKCDEMTADRWLRYLRWFDEITALRTELERVTRELDEYKKMAHADLHAGAGDSRQMLISGLHHRARTAEVALADAQRRLGEVEALPVEFFFNGHEPGLHYIDPFKLRAILDAAPEGEK